MWGSVCRWCRSEYLTYGSFLVKFLRSGLSDENERNGDTVVVQS